MANKVCDFDKIPSHPMAPKKATARSGHVNSFVSKGGKGKGKKKGRRKHMKK